MKFIKLPLFCSILLACSCNTSKIASIADIEGEWNIVEIKNDTLSPTDGEQMPFIGFDTKDGKVYGYSGCNRIMTTLNLEAEPGVIEMGHIASTLMACPQMETERMVVSALSQIKKYKTDGDKKMTLCDSANTPVMVLEKRFFPMTLSELNGKWQITSVLGTEIPQSQEKTPYIVFDTDSNSINGNAGCNNFRGKLEASQGNKPTITISSVASTRMLCPDMEIENNILSALNNVKTFGRLSDKKVALYTSSGIQVMALYRD